MNKELFIQYIENPEKLDNKSLGELQTLVEEYPYFQLAKMLYAKNLHNINDIKYDKQMKLTSAYVNNREKLYFLINSIPKKLIEEKSIKKEVVKIESSQEIKDESSLIETETDIVIEEKVEKLIVEKEESVIIAEKETEPATEISAKKTNIADEILQRIDNIRNVNEIKKEESIADIILRKASESRAKIEEKTHKFELNLNLIWALPFTRSIERKEKKLDNKKSINIEFIYKLPLINSIFEQTISLVQKTKREIELIDVNLTLKSSLIWKLNIKEEKVDDLIDINYVLKTTLQWTLLKSKQKLQAKSEEFSFNEWLSFVTKKDVEEINLNKQVQNKIYLKQKNIDLIDKFIQDEPRMKSPLDIPSENEDISLKTTGFEDGLITETLANIYIKQGHYEKAIGVYQKLSLTNSENYAYFANQIEKLLNQIN